MPNVIVDKNKIDLLANAIADKSGEPVTMTLDEMVDAVDSIETGGGIAPTGNIDITQAGVTDVTNYATATVPQADPDVYRVYGFETVEGVRKWWDQAVASVGINYGFDAGYLETGVYRGNKVSYNAIPTGTSVTPTESSQTIGGANVMMEGAVTVSAIPSDYVGSGITHRSSSDLTASGATVSVPSGFYENNASKAVSNGTEGTPTATKGTVTNHSVTVTPSVTNSAGYISGGTHNGTAVSVSASELVSGSQTVTENDTYDVTNLATLVVNVSGGGSSTIQLGTKTATLSATASSISFTGLSGNPTSFVVTSSAGVATNTNGVTGVVWDGTNLHGQTMTTQVTADTGFNKSYSSRTLTVTATTAEFQANEYKLVYTYNGTSSDIHTSDVQVGSGATSITFSSLSGRPIYWSCIFKSDFSTSSGYQRVIEVVDDGTNIYGMAMDSSAKAQTSWSATYSGGDLTITSTGTNNGGYFHQPGYYQLTYAVDASAPQYQTKSVSYTPSTTQQTATVTPDNGYDALDQVNVTVNAMPSMTLPSSASATSSGTSKATITPTSSAQYLNIPTGYNATAQYYTIGASGGGGSVQFDTKTATASNYPTSLAFTSMKGEPKAFVVRLNAQVSSSGNTTYYYIVDISHFGTTTHGNCFRVGSTRRVDNITSGYSYTYSGTTLTITSSATSRSASPGAFYSGSYELLYAY